MPRGPRWLGTTAGLVAACAMSAPPTILAQGVVADVGYVSRSGPDIWAWRAGYTAHLTGPVWWQLHGVLLNDAGSSTTQRYGAGLELNAWRTGTGPFLAASLDLGIVRHGDDDAWGSWTAGAGYGVGLVGGLSAAADIRWRGFLSGEPGGLQLGAGLAYHWGGGANAAAASLPAPPAPARTAEPVNAPPGSVSRLREGIVASAREAMGQPYRWGGQGDGGYDCSGLIQYAYTANGVTVPRTSADQSQVGDPVGRDLDALAPGDILTFSANPGGGRTTHVGLYLGGGRFIHSSSSRGVMESSLQGDDPNGAWWFSRWTGARRIVTDQ